MTRARAMHNPGVSLFPFLAVLICTMGVMMLLLVIINRPGAAALDDSTPPPDAVFGEGGKGSAAMLAAADAAEHGKSKPGDSRDQLAADRQVIDWRIAQLKIARDKTLSDLRNERLRLSTVEDGMRQLRDQWATVKKAAGDIEQADFAKNHDVDEIEAAIARLKSALTSTHYEIGKAVAAARFQPPAYAIVAYDGANGTRRQPIYIECRGDAVILQPEGIVLVPKDFKGPHGPGNPLASTIRAARDYLAGGTAPVPGREPYPLLIVRSDGIEAFYLAKRELESWGSDFGYELIEADRKLVYQQPIAQLAQIERAALADARARYAWFATTDTGKDESDSHPRPVYRASRSGGIRRDGEASLADADGAGDGNGDGSGDGSGDANSFGGNGGGGNGSGGNATAGTNGLPGGSGNGGGTNGYGGSNSGNSSYTANGSGGNGSGGNGYVGNGGGGNGSGTGSFGSGGGAGNSGGSLYTHSAGGNTAGGIGATPYGNGPALGAPGSGSYGAGGTAANGSAAGGFAASGNPAAAGAPNGTGMGGTLGGTGGAAGATSGGTGPALGAPGSGSYAGSPAGSPGGGQPFVPGSNYMGLPGGGSSSPLAAGAPNGLGNGMAAGGTNGGTNGGATAGVGGAMYGSNGGTPGYGATTAAAMPTMIASNATYSGGGFATGFGGGNGTGNANGTAAPVSGATVGSGALGSSPVGSGPIGSGPAGSGTITSGPVTSGTVVSGAMAGNQIGFGGSTAGGSAPGQTPSPYDPNAGGAPSAPAGNMTSAQAGSSGGSPSQFAGNLPQSGDSAGSSGSPSGLDLMMQRPQQSPKQSSNAAYSTETTPYPSQTDSQPHLGEYVAPPPQYISDQPKPKDDNAPRPHDSLAEKRGVNWSLPTIARLSNPVERTIHIECRGDCLILKPGIGNPQPRVIPLGPRTADSVDKLVAAVWDYARGWGIAGEKMYWKPRLQLEVGMSGEGRIADLKALMANSGLDVTSKPAAMAATSAMPYR